MMQQVGDVLTGLKNQDMLGQNALRGSDSVGKYHPYRSPPDLTIAISHGQAKKVYVSKEEDHLAEEGRDNCPCCGLPIEGEPIPLDADLERIYHIGCGYALYFQTIKQCISLLLIIFIISGIFNVASDVARGDCSSNSSQTDTDAIQYCLSDYITNYTIANKRNGQEVLEAQLALNFVSVFVVILFFHFMRYQLRKTSLIADDRTVTPSDYTVKLRNVPLETKTREIKDWLESFATDQNPVVVRKIVRSYDLVEYTDLTRERDALADQKDKETSPEIIQVIDSQIHAVHQKIVELRQRGLSYAHVAYATFQNAMQANYIESRFEKSLARKGVDFVANALMDTSEQLHGQIVKVKRAPEPSDILWENLGFIRSEKRKRKHLTTLLTAICVIVSFGFILVVSYGQNKIIGNGNQESNAVRVLSMGASVLIVIVNYILGQIIRKLAEYEKHGTYTGYFTGIARKLSIAQFINTALTTLAAKFIVTSLVYVQPGVSSNTINFYGKGGLLEGMFFVFISNAFVTPAMNIFDPFYFLKLFKQWRILRNPDDHTLDQKEAHAIFEGMPIDMSYKYALLVKTMLLTSFYAPAIPVCLLFATLGLILVYWSDKYILLRRAALPFSLGDELSKTMVEYLEWAPCMFAAGNAVFYYTLKDQNTDIAFGKSNEWLVWLTVGISIIHVFMPMHFINKRLFRLEDEVTETDTYDQARIEFLTDYDIENPITHQKALDEFRRVIAEAAFIKSQTGFYNPTNIQINQEDFEDLVGESHFQNLEGYLKTTHSNPIDVAHHNKGQAMVYEAQIKGASYDRSTNYKGQPGRRAKIRGSDNRI